MYVFGSGCEWINRFGLGFTNPVGTSESVSALRWCGWGGVWTRLYEEQRQPYSLQTIVNRAPIAGGVRF